LRDGDGGKDCGQHAAPPGRACHHVGGHHRLPEPLAAGDGRRGPQTPGRRAAHNVSALTGIAAFAAYFSALDRRWPIPSTGNAVRIGAA
jgi:hypothetical protein